MNISVPFSIAQEDAILKHALGAGPLGVLNDERAWMVAQVHLIHPTAVITAAEMDIENAQWHLTIKM